MFNKIRLLITGFLGAIFGSSFRITHGWTEFKKDIAEFDAEETRREAAKLKIPLINGCSKRKHNWQHRYDWQSGIYDSGAVRRKGWRCFHCGKYSWSESDENFVKAQPEWLLITASIMPERFLEYFTTDQLQKRVDSAHDREATNLISEQKTCTERLAELAELAEQGKLTLTSTS